MDNWVAKQYIVNNTDLSHTVAVFMDPDCGTLTLVVLIRFVEVEMLLL